MKKTSVTRIPKKYRYSRKELAKRLDELHDRLSGVDVMSSTPYELEHVLGNLISDFYSFIDDFPETR